MFGDVWKWAGSYRLSDKNIGVPWASVPQTVAELLHRADGWRRTERYSWDEWGVRFHHRLVEIHPFANGNGRHARLMTDAVMTRAGQTPFSWGRVGTQSSDTRERYIAALREADARDFAPLLAFVRT
jgi:Fic-DOC domain mobile mystery protein B